MSLLSSSFFSLSVPGPECQSELSFCEESLCPLRDCKCCHSANSADGKENSVACYFPGQTCETPAPAPAPTPGPECFPSRAHVQVWKKGPVEMQNLQLGDLVLVPAPTAQVAQHNNQSVSSQEFYEPIYAFGHINRTKRTQFLRIHTASGTVLEITPAHLVPVHGRPHPVAGETIQLGDQLLSWGQEDLVDTTVNKIETVWREGVFAPLTPSGWLVVNGVSASCYICLNTPSSNKEDALLMGILSHHDFLHMTLAPLRMGCQMLAGKVSWEQDVSSDGMPYYVAWGLDVLQWAIEQPGYVKNPLLLLVVVLAVTAQGLEFMFSTNGPALLSVLLTAMIGIIAVSTKKLERKRK